MKSAPAVAFAIGTCLAGCSDGGSTGPSSASVEDHSELGPTASSKPAADICGAWEWSSEERLTIPDWVAGAVFGIQPEGPVTLARCLNAGTMTLNAVGASFTGSSDRTAHECVTSGGQVFQDPGAFVPAAITDGRITGRSAHWVLDGPVVDCPHRAVITAANGIATGLVGGARCVVPGHPKSDIPLPPPPAGTSKTIEFTAARP